LIVACIGRMSLLFGIVAARLRRWRRPRFARGALRMALAGRRAARAVTRPGTLLRLGVLSLTKWLFNLAAIGTVLLAQLPAVPLPAALVVAAVFNLATVVPVQTIGGIGLGELGFAAALGFYGYDLATAAAAALVLRAVLLAAPLVFFVLVVVPERMLPPTRAELA
ncbi:MAG: lysylphosphatidylglycerol synthase domain-containing protein, partial [Gammaproteobacteria bacterium]